ncbi:MAG: sugar phosphate nucleotidyltransferase [Candidatus Uhrbacteria bacterium]|nr:NTP transferase domain-containing protein [Patescibacteria group bacterium]MBU1906681.1 NTP transferase domain-containing protein [Patescibacteria group bacterium]
MKAVILAGGGGTRLWPMSREDRPKQFFSLISEEPLVRDTYRRLLRWFDAKDIFFAVSPAFVPMLQEAFPEVEDDHIIVEPAKRDTGPAMGYAAAILELTAPDEPVVFIPADHWIKDQELYLRCFQVGDDLIQTTGKMLDIAITPTFPSTVLGYTQVGEQYRETFNGIDVFDFKGHVEKPDYETAKQFIEDGNYLWHANYYMWTPRKFMEAFETYAPAIGETLRMIQQDLMVGRRDRIKDLFLSLPSISIDYAVTEKMNPEDVLIIKGEFGWSDIGAWDTLHEQFKDSADADLNVTRGRVVTVDSRDNLIYASEERLIGAVGVSNLVVIDTGDAMLVCPKNEAQRVKELLEEIKKQGHQDIL